MRGGQLAQPRGDHHRAEGCGLQEPGRLSTLVEPRVCVPWETWLEVVSEYSKTQTPFTLVRVSGVLSLSVAASRKQAVAGTGLSLSPLTLHL